MPPTNTSAFSITETFYHYEKGQQCHCENENQTKQKCKGNNQTQSTTNKQITDCLLGTMSLFFLTQQSKQVNLHQKVTGLVEVRLLK